MTMFNPKGETRKRSLLTKTLLFLGGLILISFTVVYILVLNSAREQVHSKLQKDLEQVLVAISREVDVEMLLDLAEAGEPNAAGFSDDPRYLELLAFLDLIHLAEPDVWPYLYIPGGSPNEIIFVVDLISQYEPERAAGFMEQYQSNSGFILIGLERQTFRETDAQFILMIRSWSDQIGIPWLKTAGYQLADWLSGLGVFPNQEFGIYRDEFGSWASGYMPIENQAGEKVAAVGVDYKATLVETEYQCYRRMTFGVMLFSLIIPVIFTIFLIRRVIRPLQALNRIAGRIRENNSTNKRNCSSKDTFRNFRKKRGYDEIDSLADVLQDMVEKLQQRERRYHAVIDAQDALILRTTPDGQFTFSNQAYDDLRGIPGVNSLAGVTGDRIHPEDHQESLAFLSESMKTISAEDTARKHEMRLFDRDGNLKWYLWTITGIFNEEGKITEYQGVGQDITELKDIQHQLERTRNRLRDISHELMIASEQERSRIAREVHDDMLNYISELVLNLEGDIPAEEVNRSYQMIADRLRDTVYNLRPPMLAYGLNYGIKDYVHSLTDRLDGLIQLHVDLDDRGGKYPQEVVIHIFRIVQQACENAIEHANPANISIAGELLPDEIKLVVADDGIGFDWNNEGFIDDSVGQNRFGLAGIFERGLLVGADVKIASSLDGEGTRIEIRWQDEM